MPKKITVCIPTYGCDATIGETLKSVTDQDYKDYQVMTFNGKGLANVLNYFRLKASGELLLFLSGDDILLPGAMRHIDMAMAEPDISVAIRPYYWFKDDWTKPLRMTKQEKFRIEDLVFLTGQLSGICVRRSELKYPFKEKRFVEFASGVLPILKSRKSVILKHNTVAVRIDSSDARKKHVYNESPTRNWVDVVMESYSDNPKLIKYLIDKISTNYIGLIQVKSYGGLDSVLDEISLLIKLRKRNMINLKFIFYSLLVILTPSFALRYMSRWFIYNVNQWFIAHGRR